MKNYLVSQKRLLWGLDFGFGLLPIKCVLEDYLLLLTVSLESARIRTSIRK